jgi:hypothetical protein
VGNLFVFQADNGIILPLDMITAEPVRHPTSSTQAVVTAFAM